MSEFFEFDIIPSDDPDVREADQGFLTEVSWTVTAPEGGKSHGVRRVLVPSAADAVVQLGLLSQPEPVAPYTGGYALAPDLAAEVATRAAADTALDGRVDALEVAPPAHTHPLSDVTDAGTAAAADVGDFATAAQGALADSATQPGDLATVATTGAYADLSGKPTLGTAAATAATDYASAAQGVKADSASQPGHAHAGGDITSGTVAYARLPVGTAASTLAAGDDSRITGAAQKSANLSDLASASTARTNLGLTDSAVVGALPIPDPGGFYPTDTITAALQLIGGRERYGTGSPEGVVTAAVGTYYTDTDITNGAMRWAKKTGTGTTGWRVTVGDTGWRNISALIGNGWTGLAYLRRVGDVVDLRVDTLNAAAATAGVYLALPAGFRTNGSVFVRSIFYTTAMTLRRVSTFNDSTVTGYVAGDVLYGSLAASTAEPWPTSLPGVA